ncbi:hypothetical protein NST39_06370 [Bacillus sp. FSL W8-0645]|uniref:hypothetical protein n=1 Tax=Bacillus sp. FSL W8-0645 TaxID=2954627 RepID=UPI0030FB4DE8
MTPPDTLVLPQSGTYDLKAIVSADAGQAGPLFIDIILNGVFAIGSGRVNATTAGLEVTAIGFAAQVAAGSTLQLRNVSGQAISINLVRFTVVKIS